MKPIHEECPDCEYQYATLSMQPQRFLAGTGRDAVEIRCEVPVYQCQSCGSQWTGGEAEDARQAAVCRHFGRLTPAEVLEIRESFGLSQAEFSRITGLGEASLSRWETGAQMQNASADRLLRLLRADPRNLRFLRELETVSG